MQLADLLSQLDPRPDVRGRQFERICGWYLRNAPEYRERVRKVWQWSEWPGAWAADAGIDLVAKERDGRLWAIQAKAYDPSYAIKKSDVDSFLSEPSRPQFSYRLLIATTDHLGPTARRTLESQREPVGYLLRSQLELAHVTWPASPDDLRPRRPPRKKPLPHVREAIKATVTGFADQERGQLIMACGTGKTLAAMWVSERLCSSRTLVLVPSLSLLAQTLREWSTNASESFDSLAVCSDQTVVGEDEFVQHTPELGFPVTTDPAVIAAFLRRRGRRVVFATYQSSPQIAAAYRGKTPQFDLAIADEAHRCAGRASSEFATILDSGKIRSRRRLFMTATPRFLTPRLRKEAGIAGFEVASMDDEAVFGPVLHGLTFAKAIDRELLSDYQVVVVGVNNEMYRTWAERGEFVTPDGEKVFDARTLAGHIAVAKTMRRYDLRRVISFHSRVKSARKFSEDLPYVSAWMPARARPRRAIWSEHVSGAMSSGHRERLLLRFRDLGSEEIGLLSNARCLGEGVDVPTLDGVAFIDPRGSTTDIIQAVGRAIRKAPDKSVGTIVLPVFIADEDPAQALDDSTFRCVWDVLKALRAHDETLGEELDELRRSVRARRSPLHRPQKIKLDLPIAVVSASFAEAFNTRLVEQTTESWQFWYGLLMAFVARERHAQVPGDHKEDGYRLGGWVGEQRKFYRRGRLTQERIRRLEEVEGWTWDALEDAWEASFARLRSYADRTGTSAVPSLYVEPDRHQLGQWVGTQRRLYNQGELGAERTERLASLPGWRWHTHRDAWERGFDRLMRFYDEHGHVVVPKNYQDAEGRLDLWVLHQREAYRRGSKKLSEEQIRQLAQLPGWTWDPKEAAFTDGLEHLRRYTVEHGDLLVPNDYVDGDGFKLGQWVQNRRKGYKKGHLATSSIEALEAVPGWSWSLKQDAWEKGYQRLTAFVSRQGHSRVNLLYQDLDGYKLGSWVANQRHDHATGRLAGERVARLEQIDGWVWVATGSLAGGRWEQSYDRLRQYVDREGHARVPNNFIDEDGFRLGAWVAAQRRLRRKQQLASDRAQHLEALNGWTWDTTTPDWDASYAHLVRYASRHGHSRVPRNHRDDDGFPLGSWVHTQRQAAKTGKLSERRAQRLDALPGWTWDARERVGSR